MQNIALMELIKSIEYGRNIHISVVFFNDYGNYMTELPFDSAIHSKPFCYFMKSTKIGYEKCYKCRCLALKKAVETKKPFGGFCFNGIWEYCNPVIYENNVIAVIMIGNIIRSENMIDYNEYYDTLQKDFPEKDCRVLAKIVSQHIKLLIKIYGSNKRDENSFIQNIKTYIFEWLYTDISVKNLSSVFGYNEKYLGKLFKKHTGLSVKQFINLNRLQNAAELLKSTELSVTDISLRCGYNNVTYFTRIFKRQFNTTPKEYRTLKNSIR